LNKNDDLDCRKIEWKKEEVAKMFNSKVKEEKKNCKKKLTRQMNEQKACCNSWEAKN
jgi:hypothetical protein